MRISTNQIYRDSLSSLMTRQIRVNELREQIATGKKVTQASDDPISFAEIEWMNQRLGTTEVLQKNCMSAKNALNLEETMLSSCMDNIQRLREIQVAAGDATLSQTQRNALSVEASDILGQLIASANTKDNDGNYLFSGGQTNTQPFSLSTSGQYIYNGDSTQRFQVISGSLQIAINDPGDSVFMRMPNGNGTFSVSANAANAGTVVASTGSVTDTALYVPDDYTISFALNSAGEMVAMVTGLAGGNIIPPSGLPDDAPLYQAGMSLSFNGMAIELSGTPEVGDTLLVQPSQNVSLFDTIQAMISNLNMSFNTASQKAATFTENNQLLAQFDTIILSMSSLISNLGSRLNQIDVSANVNDDMILECNKILTYLSEVDPAEVYVDYNQELLSFEAAQKSFVRIQSMSVFNYF